MMESERKKFFATAMIFYSRVLPHFAPDFTDNGILTFWFDALGNTSFEHIKLAMDKLVSSKRSFPTIGEVKELLCHEEADPSQEGRLIAGRIAGAITLYGYCNPDRAESYIGEEGWEVVKSQGGWIKVCEIKNEELPTMQAQWRTLAEVAVKRKRSIVPVNPALGATRKKMDNLISGIAETMALKGKPNLT